jgi:hypothetical protein
MSFDTPHDLRSALIALFPGFGAEQADEPESYHRVVMDLAPLVTRYLEQGSPGTAEAFGTLVSRMVGAGGDQQNAIETGLLEHASQLRCARLIRPHLDDRTRRALR